MRLPTRTTTLALALVALAVCGATTVGATSNHLGIEAEASDAEAGGTTTVTITFSNNGDERTGAIVDVTSMPDGWEIQNHSDDGGSWNDDESKWLFQGVQAGSSVEPSVTLSIPEDASGDHEIEVQGSTTDSDVSATATVSLGSEDDGDSGDGEDGDDSDEDDSGDEGTSAGGPGFGVAAALAALLAATLLVLRRR